MYMQNQNHYLLKFLLVLSVVLAIIAVYIGQTYYPHEDGGPARYIGLVAFVTFIASLIFRQRAKQAQTHQEVTAMKDYGLRIVAILVALPLFLFLAYWAWFMAAFGGTAIPLLFIPLGIAGLFYFLFRE